MFCSNCGKELPSDATFCPHCGAKSKQPRQAPLHDLPRPALNACPESPYAGFWKRFLAYILDSVVLVIGLIVFAMLLAALGLDIEDSDAEPLVSLSFLALIWLYFALMESSSLQATLGKLTLGIKVTDLNGERVSLARASGRFFAKFVSLLLFCAGYVMVGLTARKQGLHDIIAGCLVLNKNAELDQFTFS
jgi:uncharacterized RDD family membrane protein YckC